MAPLPGFPSGSAPSTLAAIFSSFEKEKEEKDKETEEFPLRKP
jgi:hypothetical protein